MTTTLMTVAEAAKELRKHPQHVYRLVWSGALAWTNVSSGTKPSIRISRAALDRFIKARESGGAR